jgi:hypothetical protein
MASREEQEYSSQAPAGYIGDLLSQTIFPYATQYFKDQFANLGTEDSSPFTYTGQRVADFDPRERLAMQLSDSAIGSYRPYLGASADLLNQAGAMTRGSTGQFDPSMIDQFYNPFEDAVVDQTLEDINRGFAQSDIGLRDRAVSQGAFGGSRGRIAQNELGASRKFIPERTPTDKDISTQKEVIGNKLKREGLLLDSMPTKLTQDVQMPQDPLGLDLPIEDEILTQTLLNDDVMADEPTPLSDEQGFLSKYKKPLMIVGGLLVLFIGYRVIKK